MTKKHFIRAAKIISGVYNYDERVILAMQFADLFASTNPLFKRGKFMEACKVDESN